MGDMSKLVTVALACGMAAVTALAIAVVPLVWHPREKGELGELMAFAEAWPSRAIEPPVEPAPNVVEFEPPLLVPPIGFRHPVKTVKFVPITVVPKTGLKVDRQQPDDPPPKVEPRERRDYCFPGHKVEHGRRWRCAYAGGRHRRGG